MKTRIWTATCAAIALGLTPGLLAQENPQTQEPSQRASAKSITVTGCVQRAEEQAPTGTSGMAGAPAARGAREPKFLLTNAALSTEASGGTAGTSGATGTPPSTSVASEYRLDAEDAKLSPHVGHKVEISGTVSKPSAAGTQPPAASAANAPKLKVDTVRMIAATCP